MRLKHRVAVREDDGAAELAHMRERLCSTRIQPPRKRIAEQERGKFEDSGILRRLESISLHRVQIICKTELAAQRLEDGPEAIAPRGSELLFDMKADVRFDAVVIEQCVVDIE